MTIRGMIALFGALIAVCTDTADGKIRNGLILLLYAAGIGLQAFGGPMTGGEGFLPGAALPLLLLVPLFHFRMIGGGDVKLLSALGGILGLSSFLVCFVCSLLLGAAFSFLLLMWDGGFCERFGYFRSYLSGAARSGAVRPYLREGRRPENIHFSVPVLMGVMLYAGGLL